MTVRQLNTGRVLACVEPETRRLRVTFLHPPSLQPAAEVYWWLVAASHKIDLKTLDSAVFDFRPMRAADVRQVALLARGLPDLTMNGLIDHLPIALVVANYYQRELALKAMRVQPGAVGRRVVWSDDEADNYIRSWSISVLDTAEVPRVG